MTKTTVTIHEDGGNFTFSLPSDERMKWPHGRPRVVVAKNFRQEPLTSLSFPQLRTITSLLTARPGDVQEPLSFVTPEGSVLLAFGFGPEPESA